MCIFLSHIDSPVWKRQQQQQLRKSHSVIGSSPVHKVAIKSQRALSMQMWNITEIPSIPSVDNHLTATANSSSSSRSSSSNSNSNSSSNELADTVKRQYSFNYDHLDDDIITSSMKQQNNNNVDNNPIVSDDPLTQGNNSRESNNQKVSLNISLDNLSSISIDSDFKLKQISFLINVRLESSNSRKKFDTTTMGCGTPSKGKCKVTNSIVESYQSFNRKLSKSDTNVNSHRGMFGFRDDTLTATNNVCRKRKTGVENCSSVETSSVVFDRCLKRVKSDSNCIEFHM